MFHFIEFFLEKILDIPFFFFRLKYRSGSQLFIGFFLLSFFLIHP